MIKDFTYLRPGTLQEALLDLSKYKEGCKVICGGQSLLILLRQGLVTTDYLIDIKSLKDLNYIQFDEKNGLKIGATTTHRDIELSGLVKDKVGVLADMERMLASVQTRNWGTIGGNLCHGDPSSDPAVVLIALGAMLKMASSSKERKMAVEDFFLDYFETALGKDELLVEIHVPVQEAGTAVAYDKFTVIENDMGVVSVAAAVTLERDGATCKSARIALGNVAPIPKRAINAEKVLVGEKLNEGRLRKAGQMAREEAEPISDIHGSDEFRRHLVGVYTEKVVRTAWEQARTLAR